MFPTLEVLTRSWFTCCIFIMPLTVFVPANNLLHKQFLVISRSYCELWVLGIGFWRPADCVFRNKSNYTSTPIESSAPVTWQWRTTDTAFYHQTSAGNVGTVFVYAEEVHWSGLERAQIRFNWLWGHKDKPHHFQAIILAVRKINFTNAIDGWECFLSVSAVRFHLFDDHAEYLT